MKRTRLRAVAALCVVFALSMPVATSGFIADFFDGDASGNAVYEDMAIRPEAIYDAETGKTIVAYQGYGSHPYVAAYDHETHTWQGPFQAGTNPLVGDAHGGPALVIDAEGYVHVFYGAHLGTMLQSRSALPHDVSSWQELGPVALADPSGETTASTALSGTYPQPMLDPDGRLRLYYRNTAGDATDGYWYSVSATDGLEPWDSRETVLQGIPGSEGWYASFTRTPGGDVACGFLLRDFAASQTDYFIRRNVYYMRRDAVSGTWLTAAGASVPETRTKETLDAACLAYDSGTRHVNEVVAKDTDTGPCMLFVEGIESPRPVYMWRFVRWSSAEGTWTTPVDIAPTDNFFDAGTFQVLPDGDIEAFLTTGGFADESATLAEAALATRGGDIVRYVSHDGGAKFEREESLKVSPGPWARYNDPQIVDGVDGGPRVFFSEWDNDYANYVHKVYLWGDDGFAGREFTPRSFRLAGVNRVGTAVEVSKQAFASGAVTVVIASRENFPDALCGVPLAYSLRAPVLLTDPRSLDASAAEEIRRLGATKAIVLGSETAIASAVVTQVRAQLGAPASVRRIGGKDRYETSALIAKELAAVRGTPARVVIASGVNFPDALAASPLAARKNMPVLLTQPSKLVTATADAVTASGATSALIVGSTVAVDAQVEVSLAFLGVYSSRLAGDDRWETARAVNEYALSQGMSLERFIVCTGENFPDALTGGVLAARVNGPVLLTRQQELTPVTAGLLSPRPDTLEWYVLGSDLAVSPDVANEVATRLMER